jgi:hypothetical protein
MALSNKIAAEAKPAFKTKPQSGDILVEAFITNSIPEGRHFFI